MIVDVWAAIATTVGVVISGVVLFNKLFPGKKIQIIPSGGRASRTIEYSDGGWQLPPGGNFASADRVSISQGSDIRIRYNSQDRSGQCLVDFPASITADLLIRFMEIVSDDELKIAKRNRDLYLEGEDMAKEMDWSQWGEGLDE